MTHPISLNERRTQRQRKQDAETAIITAAIAIIAEKGLAGLTLAAAGEQAGYSRGIASHHFGKKDELLIAVVNHITRSFNDYLAHDKDIRPGLAMILKVIERYLNDIKNNSVNVRAWQLILTEAVSNPVLKPALEKVNTRSVKNLARHIEQGISDGDVREDIDSSNQALIILSTLRGVMGHWLVNPHDIDMKSLQAELVANIHKQFNK